MCSACIGSEIEVLGFPRKDIAFERFRTLSHLGTHEEKLSYNHLSCRVRISRAISVTPRCPHHFDAYLTALPGIFSSSDELDGSLTCLKRFSQSLSTYAGPCGSDAPLGLVFLERFGAPRTRTLAPAINVITFVLIASTCIFILILS